MKFWMLRTVSNGCLGPSMVRWISLSKQLWVCLKLYRTRRPAKEEVEEK
jgi:hypothetical protein